MQRGTSSGVAGVLPPARVCQLAGRDESQISQQLRRVWAVVTNSDAHCSQPSSAPGPCCWNRLTTTYSGLRQDLQGVRAIFAHVRDFTEDEGLQALWRLARFGGGSRRVSAPKTADHTGIASVSTQGSYMT